MTDSKMLRLRDWSEPAHPGVIRLYDELIQVYRAMRQRQKEIDAAFDRVAAKIGFVVTTTLPVRLEVGDAGDVKSINLDGEALRGTLFEHELTPFLADLVKKPLQGVPQGTYRFYLIWYDALRLKLRRDWIEPAHVVRGLLEGLVAQPAAELKAVRPEVREPVHWFDPGIAIAIEDAVVISAIDEVYPELRLAERIAADRMAIRRIRPEVQEPVHFRGLGGLEQPTLISQLKEVLARYQG